MYASLLQYALNHVVGQLQCWNLSIAVGSLVPMPQLVDLHQREVGKVLGRLPSFTAGSVVTPPCGTGTY